MTASRASEGRTPPSTPTNTLSELDEVLLNDKSFQHILKSAPQSQRELMTFELAKYFTTHISKEVAKELKLIKDGAEEYEIRVGGENETGSTIRFRAVPIEVIDEEIKKLEE